MVVVKPAGLATTALVANQVSLTVSFIEQYHKPKGCKNSSPIQTSVSYSTGSLTTSGTSVFIPIIATITAVYLMRNGESKGVTFTEVFEVAMQGQDALASSVTIESLGRINNTSNSCCGTTNLIVDDSITVAIA